MLKERYIFKGIGWIFSILLCGFLPSSPLWSQDFSQKVILVNLDVANPADAGKCYGTTFDKAKVELTIGEEHPLSILSDYSLEEDVLTGPNCFMPEMKLIYKDYTYVVSLYCASSRMYKNSAPFTPSSTQLKNDLEFTETVEKVLVSLRKKHFGVTTNSKYASAYVKREPFAPLDTKVDDVIVPDDKDDDSDLQNDALDKEGWFEEESPDAVKKKIEGEFKTGDDEGS